MILFVCIECGKAIRAMQDRTHIGMLRLRHEITSTVLFFFKNKFAFDCKQPYVIFSASYRLAVQRQMYCNLALVPSDVAVLAVVCVVGTMISPWF